MRRPLVGDPRAPARATLLVLVFGMPVLFLWGVTHDPFNVPKVALLATCVAVAGSLRVADVLLGAPRAGLRRLLVPVAFVAVPAAVAWLFSDYRAWSLLGEHARFEGLVPVLLTAAAGLLLADAFGGDFRRPAWALVTSAAVVGLYEALQSVGIDPFDILVTEYAPSTVGHSNFVGGFLAITFPVSLALWTSSTGTARVAGMAATIAISLGILMAFSQGGWLATVGGTLVFAGLTLGARYRRAPLLGGLGAAATAAAGAGLVLLTFVQPFHPLAPDTARARGFWWRAAVSMGADSPVWGHGPNVYAIEGPHHRLPQDAIAHDTLVADAPHSVPLSLFANHGALGVAGYVLLLAWVVRRARRGELSPLRRGCIAGVAAYYTQSLVSIDSPLLLFALWACVAGVASGDAEPGEPTPPSRSPGGRRALAGALVVAVPLATVWWGVGFVGADARALGAVDAIDRGDVEDALAGFEELVRADDRQFYLKLYAAALGQAALQEPREGAPYIERMKEVYSYVDEFPNVQALGAYGETLHQWSVYEASEEAAALEQLERLLAVDEWSPTARMAAAEALIRLGRPDDAVETMEFMRPEIDGELHEYARFHPGLWGSLAVAYFHAGRVDDARAAVEDALAADAGRPPQSDCNVMVAQELLRTDGAGATRREYVESSPGLLVCNLATLALLPGYEPERQREGIF